MMQGFVFLMHVITKGHFSAYIFSQFLHSPRKPLFHVHRQNHPPKIDFGLRNEREILRFSIFQIFLFNILVAMALGQ